MSKFKDAMRGPFKLTGERNKVKPDTPTGSEIKPVTEHPKSLSQQVTERADRIVFDPKFDGLMERAKGSNSIYAIMLACSIVEHDGIENIPDSAKKFLSKFEQKKRGEEDEG